LDHPSIQPEILMQIQEVLNSIPQSEKTNINQEQQIVFKHLMKGWSAWVDLSFGVFEKGCINCQKKAITT
jgi:hypothetical protein